jgi:nucleotide-binding universal stress UspA family protein
MYMHLLLPTDGSELALRGVDAGIALAARLGASVHAFHVLRPLAAVAYFADAIQFPATSYNQQAIERAEGYLAEVSRRAQEADVPCRSSYVFDHRPYVAIIGAAQREQCDLIVMGSHGRQGLESLLLGSQTHQVILAGRLPVLVCR